MLVAPCGSSSVRRRGPSCCCPRSSTCISCAIPGSVRSTPARLAAISASWPHCWSVAQRIVASRCPWMRGCLAGIIESTAFGLLHTFMLDRRAVDEELCVGAFTSLAG